jgi:hypothetical protein
LCEGFGHRRGLDIAADRGRGPRTLWISDATATLLEDPQFSLGEGVCMQAATAGRAVMVADLSDRLDAARWPAFAVIAQLSY